MDENGVQVAALAEKVAGLEKRIDALCKDNAEQHEALRSELMALVSAQLAGIRSEVVGLRGEFNTSMTQLWRLVFGLVSLLGALAMVAWGVREVPKLFGG